MSLFLLNFIYYFLFVDQRSMYYVAQVHKLIPTTFAKYILDIILSFEPYVIFPHEKSRNFPCYI